MNLGKGTHLGHGMGFHSQRKGAVGSGDRQHLCLESCGRWSPALRAVELSSGP